jgi:hypothetical protein
MIRDLVVNLTGNNSGLKKSVNDSKSILSSFATSAKSFLTPLAAVMATATAAAGTLAAGFAIVSSRLTTLADLADRAERTGVGAGWLRSMEYAADMAGISAEKLEGSLIRLNAAIGQARGGNAKLLETFDKLGFRLDQIQAMTTEQMFFEIATALSKMPDPVDRTALAMEIFGKQAAQLVPLLANGAEGLQAFVNEAEKLGLALSDEDIAAAAAADDAIQQMTKSLTSLVDRLAVDFAPAIVEGTEYLLAFLDALERTDVTAEELRDRLVQFTPFGKLFGVDSGPLGSVKNIFGGNPEEQAGPLERFGGEMGNALAERDMQNQKRLVAQQKRDADALAAQAEREQKKLIEDQKKADEEAHQRRLEDRLDLLTGATGVQVEFMGGVMAQQVDELFREMDRMAAAESVVFADSFGSMLSPSQQPQGGGFAAAAEAGTAEAYSAINAAMDERSRAEQRLQQKILEAEQKAADLLSIMTTKLMGAPVLAVIPTLGGI